MSGSQTSLTISLVFIVLFSVAIISFAVNFANDNNSAVDISNDENITMKYYSIVRTNVSELRENSQDTFTSITRTTIEPGSDVVRSSGSFTITWSNIFSSFKNIVEIPKNAIFGGGQGFGIFFQAIGGIILYLFA